MSKNSLPHFFIIGNEKGGAGKTTCAMHLICSLLDQGLTVASIDADVRQLSLTRYLQNRKAYNDDHPSNKVAEPFHFILQESKINNITEKELEEKKQFEDIINEASKVAEVIVIDTPGSYSHYSSIAHSYADTIITPMNDSFIDLDLIAKINPKDYSVVSPSIYSEMVWKQKMVKSQRTGKSIEWIVMRNRLANVDSMNKKNMTLALQNISKRLGIKIAPGFSERVIFRELFLQGLTLVDLTKSRRDKSFSISHIAARQELRDFLNYIGILGEKV
jgi:chromosome partitioning protein